MAQTLTISSNEKQLIARAYRKMLKSIKSLEDETDKKMIRQAFELAVEAHANQRRKSGEPYILHPIEVARICAEEIGLGPTAIIAALLHDVVEDTKVTLDEIEERFGEKIRSIVDGLTKLDYAYDAGSPQAENFKKVLSTLVEDVRVVLIKMADRLHNMRTIGSMPRYKQLRIAAETGYIYAPLSHRLGLYNIKTEFQDIILKVQEPDAYHEIARKINETKKEREEFIHSFLQPIQAEIAGLGYPYRTTGRPKSISSIYNKIKTKNVTFEEVYDLFAVRIILDVPRKKEKSLCWQVYSIITDVHTPIPERLKDWVTTPKSNGYESLHTTVVGPKGRFVEVQIRSERMDDIAERGYAAHWKYKGVKGGNSVYDNWLDNIRDLLDNNEGVDAIDFIHDFKSNLFSEEVYVYTPNGDLKILPKGATALDFAFSIHTEVGASCISAKVNNKLVPMSYELQNGDQVKIQTSKNQSPKEDWLKMVKTGRARSRIRASLRKQKKKMAEFGMETLMRKMKGLKISYEENIDFLVRYYGYKNHSDFFFDIQNDSFDLMKLKDLNIENQKFVVPKIEPQQPEKQFPREKKQESEEDLQLLIDGQHANKLEYSLAPCCNPVVGDDVFGFLTKGVGVKIHRYRCPNATHLLANYSYRVVKAEWDFKSKYNFTSTIIVKGVDSGVGVIENITKQISSFLGINIKSFSIEGEAGVFEGKIRLNVMNKQQLLEAMQALENLEGISSVVRLE